MGIAFAEKDAKSQPYSIRHAFCVDYSRNRTYIGSESFYYELQTQYNRCMEKAGALIRASEENKRRQEAENRLRLEEHKRKMLESARLEEVRRRDEERIRMDEQLRQQKLAEEDDFRKQRLTDRLGSEPTFSIDPYVR